MTLMETFVHNVTRGHLFRADDCELYFDVHSSILPAYALRDGLFYAQDIEDLEEGRVTGTVVEYPSINVVTITRRSYVDFIATAFTLGQNVSFVYSKTGIDINLTYAHGMLKDGNTVLLTLGCYTKSIPQPVKDFLYSEESMEPNLEILKHFTIFIDEKLIEEPQYKTLYKGIKTTLLSQLDEYVVVKDLTEKVFTRVPLEPTYKRPAERVKFLRDLPKLLIAVEEGEVEVAPKVEAPVKKVVTVETEAPTEWVPPGFSV